MRNFLNCTSHRILLRLSNQGGDFDVKTLKKKQLERNKIR
jgi:hypothetical protein